MRHSSGRRVPSAAIVSRDVHQPRQDVAMLLRDRVVVELIRIRDAEVVRGIEVVDHQRAVDAGGADLQIQVTERR